MSEFITEQTMFRFVLLASLVACAFGSAVPVFPRLAPRLDGRIVGGDDTTIEQFPWQTSLRFWGSHRCGAVTINADTILTAGHCVVGLTAANLEIRAGSTNRLGDDGQIISVSQIILHPQYDDWTLDFDIALLKLSRQLEWTDGVQPIALPVAGAQLTDGSPVTVTGWGALWEGGPAPNVLQEVTVPVVERSRCNGLLGGGVTNNMFCAGLDAGGKDACQGDSGGPVVANNVLVGLVSWGWGCAQPNLPGVYTQVSAFVDWINSQ